MPLILGLVGLAIGAMLGQFWGAATLGIAGVLLGNWINRNDERRKWQRSGGDAEPRTLGSAPLDSPPLDDINAVREEVLALRRRVARLESGQPIVAKAVDSPPIVKEAVVPPKPVPALREEAAPVPVAEMRSTPPMPPVSTATPVATVVPVAEPNPLGKFWNWLFGGNAMVRVGVVVLFFGVAFLMKYAAEHVHVPIEVRLTGVALGAIVMLILGWRLRKRAGGYGLVLQGGGVGVLYLVVFGAFRI